MSQLATIGHQLRGLSDGLGQAQHAAAGAGERAGQIAGRAAVLGMVGVAIGVQGVQREIMEICQRLGTVGQSISTAMGLVTSAPPQPSPDQVIQSLAPAGEQIDSAAIGLADAAQQATRMRQQAHVILVGGDPGPLVQALGQVSQLVLETAQRCVGVRQAIDQAIQQARQTGHTAT